MKKLANVTGWHIAQTADAALVTQIAEFLALTDQPALSQAQQNGLQAAMYCLKERAKNLPDILDKARFILENRPLTYDEKAVNTLDPVSRGMLRELTAQLQNASWSRETLEGVLNAAADSHGLKFGKLAGPLRAALSGRTVSPSVFDMMLVLGQTETLARLTDAASHGD